MKLKKLRLKNFRKFEDLQIEFDDSLTVLVGDNGLGKSAILDAAAIALGTYLIHIPGVTQQRTITKNDARVVTRAIGSTIERRPQYPVQVQAEGVIFNRPMQWMREVRAAGGRATTVDAKQMTAVSNYVREYLATGKTNAAWGSDVADSIDVLPVVSYYGTGRLWAVARNKNGRLRDSLRENGYMRALSPQTDTNSLIQWLRKATLQQLQKNKLVPELAGVQHAMADVLARITKADEANVYYDVQSGQIMVERIIGNDIQEFSLNQLSDGYKTTLSMVADIAYRTAELNPQLGENAPSLTPGVVLIDEVDLHLHPKWQARILGDLTDIFPNIQFIVTTHSPSVVASVPREKLRMLGAYGGISLPANQTYGRDVASVYREVLDGPVRPEEVQKLFDETYQALDDDRLDDVKRLLAQLEKRVGSNDPEIAGMKTSLWLAGGDDDTHMEG